MNDPEWPVRDSTVEYENPWFRAGHDRVTRPDGEDLTTADSLELREETGYRADSLELLGSYYPSSWQRGRRHIVHATDLTAGDPELDDGEFLDVRVLEIEAAIERVERGPTTGWALTPLLLAREKGSV